MTGKQKIEYVSPSELKPNPWNPNVVDSINQQKLVNSIKSRGFFKPILVRTTEDDELEIIGGKHRVDAAITLGMDEVPILNLGKISEAESKEITIKDNSQYGEVDFAKLSDIIGNGEIGDINKIISEYPMDEDYLMNVFKSDDLDELDDFDDLNDADQTIDLDLPANNEKSHQILRFKVSPHDAAIISDVIKSIQAQHGYTESDDLTNAGDALVHFVKENTEKTDD